MTAPIERALLDTSIVIDYPADAVSQQTRFASVSTITLAELAYGLHTSDPLIDAARDADGFTGLHRSLTLLPIS